MSSGSPPEVDSSDAAKDAINCKWNINLQFAVMSMIAVNWGIMLGPVFDNYVYYLGEGRNTVVGQVESVSGITSLLVAIPVGLLVDRRPRERAKILRYASWLGLVIFGLMLAAFLMDTLPMLYVALVFYGFWQELVFSCSDAIFTDSIPRGDRSRYFTMKAMLQTGCGAAGPLLSGIGFLIIGSEWTLFRMRCMLIFGAALMPVSSFLLRFFCDPLAAGQAEEGDDATGSCADGKVVSGRCCCLGARAVPWIIASGDFFVMIGAGMTIKFFNLFFINDLHFSASEICWLTTVYPLCIALFMKVLQYAAKPCGRAPASILFFLGSVACIMLLAEVKNVWVLVVVYLVRGGFANCVDPIMRSILMDYTPSSQRGLWNAVGSLMGATWSGSAFLGGWLSDSHDYRFTFMVTGGVYLFACLLYSPLLGIVPRKEEDLKESAKTEDDLATSLQKLHVGNASPQSRPSPASPARFR